LNHPQNRSRDAKRRVILLHPHQYNKKPTLIYPALELISESGQTLHMVPRHLIKTGTKVLHRYSGLQDERPLNTLIDIPYRKSPSWILYEYQVDLILSKSLFF